MIEKRTKFGLDSDLSQGDFPRVTLRKDRAYIHTYYSLERSLSLEVWSLASCQQLPAVIAKLVAANMVPICHKRKGKSYWTFSFYYLLLSLLASSNQIEVCTTSWKELGEIQDGEVC